MKAEPNESLLTLRKAIDKLWREIFHQHKIGNRDVAVHYEWIAKETEKVYLDVCAYVSSYPDSTKKEIRAYLEEIGRSA